MTIFNKRRKTGLVLADLPYVIIKNILYKWLLLEAFKIDYQHIVKCYHGYFKKDYTRKIHQIFGSLSIDITLLFNYHRLHSEFMTRVPKKMYYLSFNAHKMFLLYKKAENVECWGLITNFIINKILSCDKVKRFTFKGKIFHSDYLLMIKNTKIKRIEYYEDKDDYKYRTSLLPKNSIIINTIATYTTSIFFDRNANSYRLIKMYMQKKFEK